ncbi:NYN domain-containing protein [Agromyces sp. CFH 90414]|uniref:NYN domain-containing protein n=1 Tax=Agromyces agglutinans TaxID=2662258 RepID=A0A6I2F529_9MICO|nr:NYN domain-containing protein [Agromyces agglutinans]MRG59742.1 NYN domain-containing protein [Agromyces agglutinans]
MAAQVEPRVALYFDFDNIVISRYDQLHGDGAYRKDTSRTKAPTAGTKTAARLLEATVDVDAVLDFAATFGTIALARAYADWSTPVNASYRGQLIDRAVDLVQLFPLSATKNGADIRLAVDAVEDLFRLDDLTHIVIVAGDSDYVALAQKAKRLGRYVVGIGVAGGTSRALTASCDEYADYDALLTTDASVDEDEIPPAPRGRGRGAAASGRGAEPAAAAGAADQTAPAADTADTTETEPAAPKARSSRGRGGRGRATSESIAAKADASAEPADEADEAAEQPSKAGLAVAFSAAAPELAADSVPSRNPSRLLLKALELMRAKNDQEWQASGAVKSQMLRMDPAFQERRLGFDSFTDFVKSRGGVVELDESANRVRIRPKKD